MALNFGDKCEKLKLGGYNVPQREVSTEDRRRELSEVASGTKSDIFQESPLLYSKMFSSSFFVSYRLY